MLNPFQTINWSPERRKIRSSAIVFAAGFLLIAGGFFGAGLWGIVAAGVVALCALLIGGTAMLFPDSFGLWFYRIWFALGGDDRACGRQSAVRRAVLSGLHAVRSGDEADDPARPAPAALRRDGTIRLAQS